MAEVDGDTARDVETAELSSFLAAYAASYESYDPTRVVAFIHCPCIFFLRDQFVLLDTPDAVRDFLAGGLDSYRSHECVRFNAKLLGARLIGPRFAFIDVEWAPENAEGVRTMHFFTTYNLARHEGRWKVTMITRHDE